MSAGAGRRMKGAEAPGRRRFSPSEDALASEPLVYKVDQTNLRRVRELLPQEAEHNLPREAEKKLK